MKLTSRPVVVSALALYAFGAGYDVFHRDTDHTAPVPINLTLNSTAGTLSPASLIANLGWNNMVTGDYIHPAPDDQIYGIILI
jgi:hypothetical protein